MSGHGRMLDGQFAFRSALDAIRCVEKQQGVPTATPARPAGGCRC